MTRTAHTVEQVRAAEATLMAGQPEGALMNRAAAGLAHAVAQFVGGSYGRRVLLLVGAGNNGGDALFAGAQLARQGAAVSAVLLGGEHTHPAGLGAFQRSGGRVVSQVSTEPSRRPDVVIDGIVGIGGRGGLRDAAAAVVAACADLPTVAVDLPSGVEADTGEVTGRHVVADLTVTFGTLKAAHLVDPAAAACGAVELVDIGLTLPEATLEAWGPNDVARTYPWPDATGHKYSRGVVGVRTGSKAYLGAAVLSVAGAQAGPAGMVRYVGGAADAVQRAHPEVVIGAGRVQACVVGSGSGSDAPAAFAEALADEVPLVIDADALGELRERAPAGAVLTPHAGELARLMKLDRGRIEAAPLSAAREAADRWHAVVVLKGRRTIIASPTGRTRVNTTGTPWLGTAGAGDVLAGLIGGLLAAGIDAFDAAAAGAWLHGSAATLVSGGGPFSAGDLVEGVRRVVADLSRSTGAPYAD